MTTDVALLVNHLSTPEEVEEFAFRGNHVILHKCVQLYRADPEVTWEQAMQLAAIELCKVLDTTNDMLIKCIERVTP